MQRTGEETVDTGEGEAGERPQSPRIIADIAASFTYASWQNAIPVIRSIIIENATARHFEACTFDLTASPAFLRPKTWAVDRLIPGDLLPLSDRKVELDATYLAGLNEAERGEITLRLLSRGEVLDEARIEVRLLARDEWGGVADMAQLLPAFVMPNDPGVPPIMRGAAERLIASGHSGALDGYQSRSPDRAFLLAASVYSAIAKLGLYYAEPPASFERRGQKIRRPATIADERLATCLDTSLLFAAALESAGLNPVILMFSGHAATGVWLVKRNFDNAIERDPMEVRKALASRELIVFETTGVTHRPAMTIEAAQRVIDHRLSEDEAHDFVAAIDIQRSRSGGITPLASHEPATRDNDEGDVASGTDLPLPSAPSLGGMPADKAEEKPTTAAGRIDRWQRKLLDLTLNNRLLNFVDSKKTVPFLCTDVGFLEDRLAANAAIRIISLPEQNPLGERDAALYRDVHGRDLQRSFAADALQKDELPSPLEPKQLEARLIDLHRQVRNDFAEGGANTLFLAVGFLRWKKKPEDARSYRAPLLLLPVKLERQSVSAQFRIRFHEDEPRFNATLLQFLERDFDLKLPQFGGDLPDDGSGVDVPALLNQMRQAIRNVPGMEVVDETALSTFSFAKFLMWKDLVERTDALRQNRVVRHLIDTPEAAFQAGGQSTFRDERELDRTYSPAEIISLLPMDSSQTAASIAAGEGHDFVIVGPPGTGKSQTIANMIANCLAAGKTVLFVAEKTAALDVVYRRLREHGLGNHCVELHSSKADRRHFLGQLKASWEQGARKEASDWIAVNERLRVRRDELNAYVEALHKVHPNGWTPYLAFGTALRAGSREAPRLQWSQARQSLTELEQLASEVGRIFAAVSRQPGLDLVDVSEWGAQWQEDLLAAAQSLRNAIDLELGAIEAYAAALGLDARENWSQADIRALANLASALRDSDGRDISIAYDPDFARCAQALAALQDSIAGYSTAASLLTATYQASALDEADALLVQLQEAESGFWPSAMFGKRKIQKQLQAHVVAGTADPEADLPHLSRMKACLAGIADNLLAGKRLPFDGLATDTAAIAGILALAGQLRVALLQSGMPQADIRAMMRAVAPFLSGSTEFDPVRQAGARMLAASSQLATAAQDFSPLSGRGVAIANGTAALRALAGQLDGLAAARTLLRSWASWCRIRRQAVAAGLSPLLEQIESGVLAPTEAGDICRLAYARWWLPKVTDGDPALRNFVRFQHENAIREFREIDDLVRSHAVHRVVGAIAHGLPSVQMVPKKSELGLLRHQMELQRPSQSIRDMISGMPQSFSKLAPCMLMSPLSIAQYLPPNQALFDVVIFDEASQITTWDAVGAIARAKQTIIVGDPKQLPPTNFFGRTDDDEDVAYHERDLESILDEAKDSGIPLQKLRWHYRSRSESLIAFSNHHYYGNQLVTFPSPSVEDRAVRLHPVPDGVYDRGVNKSRTNRIEAAAVVAEAVSRMKAWLKLPEKQRPTLGIITFNMQQQSLIMDLLDAARRDLPALEWFFAEERVEATIVKNLENVQGDERDVILFSITFWKDAAGKLTMDFGALNRDGGERRLNVAVTRARQELIVFSGFTADRINAGSSKLGVHHLKAFLDYAQRGAIALPAQDLGSVGGFDSLFEEAVSAELEARGWVTVPQVGISGFRIDLGIRHPDRDGAYLAGVECDGATYHSSATARDRDKVREQVLRGLGWNILRVWSTDWWLDAAGCAEALHLELTTLLKDSRARLAAEAPAEPAHWDMGHEVEAIEEIRIDKAVIEVEAPPVAPVAAIVEAERVAVIAPEPVAPPRPERLVAARIAEPVPVPASPDANDPAQYRIADLSGIPADPEQFFEFGYRDTLRRMIDAVMEAESPLRTDILAQRISRAHGWLRTGSKIRDRIDLHLRGYDTTDESSGSFIWKKGAIVDVLTYRPPVNDDARRSIADIPLAELASVVIENGELLDMPDPARDLARLLGVAALHTSSRARLDEAILRARQRIAAGRTS